MSGQVLVNFAEVLSAARTWTEQSEALHGVAGSLTDADTSCFGPRVATPAATFISTWATEAQRLERVAADHAEAIRGTGAALAMADRFVTGDVVGLFPAGTT